MKAFFIFLLSSISIAVSAQKTYYFTPKWKEGDTRIASVSQLTREYENGELVSDTTIYNQVRLKVIKEESDSYTLEVKVENQVVQSIVSTYDGLENDLKKFKDITLVYSVDKKAGEQELTNEREIREDFKQFIKILDREPEVVSSADIIPFRMDIALGEYGSLEKLEAYIDPYVNYLFLPFDKELSIGDTLHTTDLQDNPYDVQQASAVTKYTLTDIDKRSRICQISQVSELNIDGYVENLKNLLQAMVESAGGKLENDIEMSITNSHYL